MLNCCFTVVFMQRPFLIMACVALVAATAQAAPRVPSNDSEVIERLPGRAGDPNSREIHRLRKAATSGSSDASVQLARRLFDLAMAQGDPRYVGQAEAALTPWRDTSEVPAEVLLLRGMLKQYRHDFSGALRDLGAALQSDPTNSEARGWRAAIYLVQAEYALARSECTALISVATELVATGCMAHVDAMTGRARSAYQRLNAALARRPDAAPALRAWSETRLAEFAVWLGEHKLAEQHFRSALATGVDDNYLLAAYADFLISEKRLPDAVRLLDGRERSDTLLLRRAIAARALGASDGDRLAKDLDARFQASALRGERLHLAEEARFLLELKRQPREALAAAVENWKSQREPRDAEVLLRAALEAGDRRAASPALDWLRDSGFEDATLGRLAARLQALRP